MAAPTSDAAGPDPASPVARTGAVLTAGEAMVVLGPTGGGPLRRAETLVAGEAGAELNVAVSLARLGVPARFATRVGDDAFGLRIRDRLAVEGVDARAVVVDPTRPTGCYFKDPQPDGTRTLYYRRDSAAAAMDRLPEGALAGVGHLHLTGITAAISAAGRQLLADLLASPRPYTVSFDVNHRPALWPADVAGPVLAELARRADVVLVGLDEAERLWGLTKPADVRALLPEPCDVVVKDGSLPAHCLGRDGSQHTEPASPVDVVEPVGAGDAFAAGYLAARREGAPVPACLRLGHLMAAGALTSARDIGEPPDPATLTALRREYS